MLAEFIAFLKTVIDLLKKKREDKKLDLELKKLPLEIEKLKGDLEARNRLIQPATLEDVKKYDPKYQKLAEAVAKRFWLVVIFLLLSGAGVAWGVYTALKSFGGHPPTNNPPTNNVPVINAVQPTNDINSTNFLPPTNNLSETNVSNTAVIPTTNQNVSLLNNTNVTTNIAPNVPTNADHKEILPSENLTDRIWILPKYYPLAAVSVLPILHYHVLTNNERLPFGFLSSSAEGMRPIDKAWYIGSPWEVRYPDGRIAVVALDSDAPLAPGTEILYGTAYPTYNLTNLPFVYPVGQVVDWDFGVRIWRIGGNSLSKSTSRYTVHQYVAAYSESLGGLYAITNNIGFCRLSPAGKPAAPTGIRSVP